MVLGVLFALAWFVNALRPPRRVPARPICHASCGALNLGGRERILVVEVGEQWIVVGASPGRINTLATLPRQEGSVGTGASGGQAVSAPGFSEWLKQTIDKRNAK